MNKNLKRNNNWKGEYMKYMKKLYIAAAFIFFGLVGIAWALVPPPPANQLIGIYDTSTNNFNESLCRNCHNTTFQGGVPTRHHDLINPEQKINPMTGIVYDCLDCHVTTLTPDGYTLLTFRNCIDCHNGTAFYANSLGANVSVPRPHHNTTLAQTRECGNTTGCHGSIIDNVNDSHYIPQYNTSNVTPDTSYKAYNASSGRYWGGCEACHNGSTAISPKVNNNSDTHHNALIGVTYGMPPLSGGVSGGCLWCHTNTGTTLSMRRCEECHSVKTVHNIQYNYTATKGQLGFGHIGTNWDCNGCHAWYNYAAFAPFEGAIPPDMSSVTPSVLLADGQSTVVTIGGSNLLQDPFQTTVTVGGNKLTTTSITESQIVATVPPLTAGDHVIQVAKAGKVSRMSTLTVVTPVSIMSAKIESGTLTIVGTGLGTMPATNARNYAVVEHNGVMYIADSITSWTNSQIVAKSSIAVSGDKVIVIVPTGGSATATIEGSTPTPTPLPTPSITVTAPNGGEYWQRGTTQTITWEKVGTMGTNVKIELLKGPSVSRIANSVANNGAYSWKISSKQSIGDYKIRITSISKPVYTDTSDNDFHITK